MPVDSVTLSKKPHVLIVGGGFAGLQCAKQLAEAEVNITLMDRHNYHLFQPLLYQVATAALSPADIAAPIRRILRKQQNVRVVMETLLGADLEARVANFSSGDVSYDYLILATGVTHSYFGRDDWAPLAPGLKTVDDALEIRRRILLAYEAAEWEADTAARQADLTFIVVGGGPTGVELAGALKEIAAQTVPKDFRNINTTTAKVVLVEAADRLLGALPEKLGMRALQDLQQMGVEVRLNSLVTDIQSGGLTIGTEFLTAENIIWAAGVRGSDIAENLGVELDQQGRVVVAADLSIAGFPDTYVIGDLAHVTGKDSGQQIPGVAQAAIQMGEYVAKEICRKLREETKNKPFIYTDRGSMATIGRNRAVATIAGHQFTGFFAWLIWGVVHIFPLVNFRRKLTVLFAWVWSYFSRSKNVRLITGESKIKVKKPFGIVSQEDDNSP
ncbi:MAG: NAD(P)/FAD-dependent oxidoreductase [Desulfuromusa sp.]|nr:NAD(P)/FAD-dependent oxidoreductase [Desulfuromusa sp.]